MTDVREKIKRILRKAIQDFVWGAMKLGRIKDKRGKLTPFLLNQSQLYVHRRMELQKERLGYVRQLIIKGRQQGISTYIGWRFFQFVAFRRGLTAFILTHENKTTDNLFAMVKRFYESLPSLLRPAKKNDSAKRLQFTKRDAGYEVGTAGNRQTGRGFTAQLFHGSEVAFWPSAGDILAGLMNSIASEPDTEIVLESTANGARGDFYEMVMLAKTPKSQRTEEDQAFEYEVIFIPWYWQSEYSQKEPNGFKRSQAEDRLAALLRNHPDGEEYNHDITDDQLYWRRVKIRELNSLDKFKQEYPSYIEEAFLFSGRTVFDPNHTELALADCREPTARFSIDSEGNWFRRDDGELRVWALPKKRRRYVIGGDVAEGLVHGDFSTIDVLNESGIQVAQWHGHVPPDRLGDIVVAIAKRYNNAFVGIERNNHGLSTLYRIRDLGYTNVYFQQDHEKVSERSVRKMGWLTSSRSKPLIIDRLGALFRDGVSGIRCRDTVDECRRYVVHDNGSFGADAGCFDDRVMSYAIAQEMLRQMPKQLIDDIHLPNISDKTAGY
ncbi:hypothetical protein NFC81_09125 [Salinispirillum sp. LH 10-3-1]|uniref:Terminase n=1 Tax=Salinispirillum sp. LH 10-3-1 TaxID=2952525 RepID=A0AB38YCJ7_9GAMM